MNYSALIVAAGSGQRMGLGYNKLLYQLKNGNTVLHETMQIFLADERCKQLILVISEQDREQIKALCHDSRICLVGGGKTRQESVYQGLKQVSEAYVLIHDGARPWLSKACLDRIVEALHDDAACLLCMPVKDTIKQVVDGYVVSTPLRETLQLAQTPQAFATKLIKECYEKAKESGIVASDDAQLVERCSDVAVRAIEGSYENLKITTMEDLHDK